MDERRSGKVKMYDWGIFWEDGNRATLEVPFGPVHPDNFIGDLDSDEYVARLEEYLPAFRTTINELPFGFIIVNPPREATEEEAGYWRRLGYTE